MPIPALLLGFVLASVYGVAFFLAVGKGWLDLGLYWATALAGFALGELLSRLLHLSVLPIGALNVFEASVMSLLALALLWIFQRRRQARSAGR
ncbi:MAG: hypothetical protein WCF84_07355 [Anaerolineae bacterium]